MKRWALPSALAAVAAAALFASVTGAWAETTRMHGRTSAVSCTSSRLMHDPAAVKAMQQLHQEHAADMQAWSDRLGADPSTPEAQQALATLRAEHTREMRELLKRFGIKTKGATCGAGTMSMMDGNGMTDMMNGDDMTDMMGGSGTGSGMMGH